MTPSEIQQALARHAASLLAVDPFGLGGAVLRGPATPARDAWLESFRAMLPSGVPWRRMPPQIADGRLLGGLDLAATLASGRPVAERGLLAQADGGAIIVPMAERLGASAASYLGAALDTGEVVVERDGIALRAPTHFAAILLDEGIDDERAPPPLTERLAFLFEPQPDFLPPCGEGLGMGVLPTSSTLRIQPPHRSTAWTPTPTLSPQGGEEQIAVSPIEIGESRRRFAGEDIAAARARLGGIVAGDEAVEALAAAGLLFGVPSLRLATIALRTAKAAAALAGRSRIATEDAELAAALVIAPRATRIPASDAEDEPPESQMPEPETLVPETPEPETPVPETPEDGTSDDTKADDATPDDQAPADPVEAKTMADSVVEATRAAIPADLLASLSAAAVLPRQGAGGRAGAPKHAARRGRPAGTRRGVPGHGVRLAIVETLRAAAPWQKLRRLTAGRDAGSQDAIPQDIAPSRILVRREDFRVGRFKQKSETVTIFVVDASGSAALHRLAEVKGAVELVLADCYVRRDCVALIAFRGNGAELILPPTRSLVRAKRALAGLPGGGGTPLAAAIDAAGLLAQAARKKGQAPLVVLLTDGKANIARTGRPGRAEAEADAALAAQAFRLGGAAGLVLDIAPRPGEAAHRLATAMGARYIPLPYADAQVLSRTVLAAAPAA